MELLYCCCCDKRIGSEDMSEGKATKVKAGWVCPSCLAKIRSASPDGSPSQAESPRTPLSQQPRTVETGRPQSAVRRRTSGRLPAPKPHDRRRKVLVVSAGAAAGVLAAVVGGVVLLSGEAPSADVAADEAGPPRPKEGTVTLEEGAERPRAARPRAEARPPRPKERTVTFKEGVSPGGYAGTDMCLLYSGKSDMPPLKARWRGRVGHYQGPNRVVIRFADLKARIPKGAAISSAKLRLYQYHNDDAKGHTISVYQLKKRWTRGKVTWDSASKGVPWESPGAGGSSDRMLSPASTVELDSSVNAWREWDVTDVVAGWVDGSIANRGLIVQDSNESSGHSRYRCDNDHNAAQRPELVVTYTGGGPLRALAAGPTRGRRPPPTRAEPEKPRAEKAPPGSGPSPRKTVVFDFEDESDIAAWKTKGVSLSRVKEHATSGEYSARLVFGPTEKKYPGITINKPRGEAWDWSAFGAVELDTFVPGAPTRLTLKPHGASGSARLPFKIPAGASTLRIELPRKIGLEGVYSLNLYTGGPITEEWTIFLDALRLVPASP